MENEIDWKFWLKRKSVMEIQMALLTLGLNPDNFDIGVLDCHYLVNRDDLQALEKEFDKRMIFIGENRSTPYKYMATEDDSSIFYFDSRGTIKVKKFLLWLKNEDMGWDLPPELKAHIDSLSYSNNSTIDIPKDAPKSDLITNTQNNPIELKDRKYSEFLEDKKTHGTWDKCAEHYGISRQRYNFYRKFAENRDHPKSLNTHTFSNKGKRN
jgi:hypothetical protein